MNAEDLWTSVKATLYERTVSPLASSFMLSWCAVNHKFFLIFFSDEKVADKIELLNKEVFHYDLVGITNLLVLPTLSSLFLIVFFPYAALPAYRWWSQHQRKLEAVRDDLEGSKRLSLEQSRKLLADMSRLEADHSAEVSRLRSQIEALVSENRQAREQAESAHKAEQSVVLVDEDSIASSNKNTEVTKPSKETSPQVPSPVRLVGLAGEIAPPIFESRSHHPASRISRASSIEAIEKAKAMDRFAPLKGYRDTLVQIELAAPAFLNEIFEDINEGDLYEVVKSLANDGLISLHGPAGNEVVEMTEAGRETVRAVHRTASSFRRPASEGTLQRPPPYQKVTKEMEALRGVDVLEKADFQRRARELASDKSGLFHGKGPGRDEVIRVLNQIADFGALSQSEVKSPLSLEQIDRLLNTLIRLGVVDSDNNSTIPTLTITDFGMVFLSVLEGREDRAAPLDY